MDKSLVRQEETARGEPRLRLLETIREFGLDQLEAIGEGDAVRDHHAAYFLELAEAAAPKLRGVEQRHWLARLDEEHGNLRAALDWLRGRGDWDAALRLAASLWLFWYVRSHLTEGRQRLAALLAEAPAEPTLVRANALNAAGNMAYYQGDYPASAALHEQALAIRRQHDDARGIASSLGNLGGVAHNQGDHLRAASLYAEALARARAIGDQWMVGGYLNNLALATFDSGDLDHAAALHAEALAVRRSVGDEHGIAITLSHLGQLALLHGDIATAARRYTESLNLFVELESRTGITTGLEGLAGVVAARDQPARAARLYAAAEALREAIDNPLRARELPAHQAAIGQLRAALGDAFAEHWAAGRALPLPTAIDEARTTG